MTWPVRPEGLLYGGDYNPEQWPEEVWREDVTLMRAAGVNLATVGVFSWAKLEPRPGEYDFGWLDRVLDLLHAGGIAVDLATATASPPPWLAQRHPESLPVTVDGVRLAVGGRQHYCPSSSAYRERAVSLAGRIVERYAAHPAVVMWHVGNEYGCHVAECFCDVTAVAFRDWLQQRYDGIEGLNDAWGTAFWSQHYADWSEVSPPRRAPTFPNPGQQLDWRRFCSAALLGLYAAERDVVRAGSDKPVTTNFMSLFKPVDYWAWAPELDLVSNDHYHDPEDPATHVQAALACDLMRSLRGGEPWLLMEQAAGAVNWRERNPPKRPGQMRLWSMQAVARGADGICFFQWRASRAGAEKYHSGMLPHAGPDTRVHREVSALGAELADLADLKGARVEAAAALLLDWPSWWASELDSHPSTAFSVPETLLAFYTPLWHANVTCDVAHPEADLSAYRLVIVPGLYLLSDAAAANLVRFVAGGGTALVSYFSGIVDERDAVRLGGYPAPWRELLGLRVEEFLPLRHDEHVRTDAFTADLWSEDVAVDAAEVVHRFVGGDLDEMPAVTRHAYGDGVAWYLATRPEPVAMGTLLRRVCLEAGVSGHDAPPGVEVVQRGTFRFALDHETREVTVTRT